MWRHLSSLYLFEEVFVSMSPINYVYTRFYAFWENNYYRRTTIYREDYYDCLAGSIFWVFFSFSRSATHPMPTVLTALTWNIFWNTASSWINMKCQKWINMTGGFFPESLNNLWIITRNVKLSCNRETIWYIGPNPASNSGREVFPYMGHIGMCGSKGLRFFSRSGHKLGIDFGHFDLKKDMVLSL